MRKNFGSKSWLYPMPVLIVAAYDEQGKPNAMNAAWGGIFTDDHIGICISEGHKTTKNILATKAFTVSMATADEVVACDYVGIVSGNKEPDKFAKAGFTAVRSEVVNAPIIEQLPMTLECEMVSYDAESNHLVGRIVNVSADEKILTDGKIIADHTGTLDPAVVFRRKTHGTHAAGQKLRIKRFRLYRFLRGGGKQGVNAPEFCAAVFQILREHFVSCDGTLTVLRQMVHKTAGDAGADQLILQLLQGSAGKGRVQTFPVRRAVPQIAIQKLHHTAPFTMIR